MYSYQINLKGAFAKKIKGGRGLREKIYMVIATNLISICSVYKDKIVKKTTNTEERIVHTNSESCIKRLGS